MSKSESTKKVGIHPLAIASICDHYTRVQNGGSKFTANDLCVGLLFGTQSGPYVEIIDATDAVYVHDEETNEITLPLALDVLDRWNFPDPNLDPESEQNTKNKCYLVTKPYRQLGMELVGWYTLSASPVPPDWCMRIHSVLKRQTENPVFVLMNHTPEPDMKRLPLTVFETETHVGEVEVGGEAAADGAAAGAAAGAAIDTFVSLPFSLETYQTERIAVDQISKQGNTDGVSTLELQNFTLMTAVRILETKIATIIKAAEWMQTMPPEAINHSLLRRIRNLALQLPAIDSVDFQSLFHDDITDSLMTTYLGAATKTTSTLVEVTDLYAQIFKERSRSHF